MGVSELKGPNVGSMNGTLLLAVWKRAKETDCSQGRGPGWNFHLQFILFHGTSRNFKADAEEKNSQFWKILSNIMNRKIICPDWCGSLDWASFCKANGCQFDSGSGSVLGAWSRVGACARGNQLMFFSLSFSFPSLFLKNKYNL